MQYTVIYDVHIYSLLHKEKGAMGVTGVGSELSTVL